MKQLLLLLIIILSVATHAAERPDSVTVYGRVLYDKDKEPLPGVVILNLVGLDILGGCQTDVDGNFSLVAPIETELSFSKETEIHKGKDNQSKVEKTIASPTECAVAFT